MTNADKIRAMSDDELTDFLFIWTCSSAGGFVEKGGASCMDAVELKNWLKRSAGEVTPHD